MIRQRSSFGNDISAGSLLKGKAWRPSKWLVSAAMVLVLFLLAVRLWPTAAKVTPARNAAADAAQLAFYVVPPLPGARAPRRMKVGVDADNWSGQTKNPAFEQGLVAMNIDFISWHIQPGEETPEHLGDIVRFCRKHGWAYLFNTEWGNYNRNDARLRHSDGTFRYDVADSTLGMLKDDPLFLGVVYDEADLMQAMLGSRDETGQAIQPILADTRAMTANQAFDAVSSKVQQLRQHYQAYGKRIIFEMTFPDSPFAYARAGAILAPKLLKETHNDLMYAVYRGAALEYHSPELWGCIDLWFLDRFPTAGKERPGFHTPAELTESLQFANAAGFDYVYIEQVKALLDTDYQLTPYGKAVVEFQKTRASLQRGDWRTAPVHIYVKRFPDGYWGQDFSSFIPDHPYGSWLPNPYRDGDKKWFAFLQQASHGNLPNNADTWNALKSPFFKDRPYSALAGLPLFVVYDHFGNVPKTPSKSVIDLCADGKCSGSK